ncbi:MAG TPA: GNAT family N-acetyltransferase, partial [Rhodopila sp.]|uniref:GNAT family N-acetyltransferase n=1 Tax=Rhodopila sp. TaxID=2480087 RepID=UPI002C9F2CE9
AWNCLMQISNLRSVADFASTIADRCWHEWWKDSAISLSQYRSGIRKMTAERGIPMALVAHREEQYLGSVLLIDNDLDIRPQYSPWIAALWVEPGSRRQGIAGKLIQAARTEAKSLGHQVCYLCATETNSPYYMTRGFRLIELDVVGLNIFVI